MKTKYILIIHLFIVSSSVFAQNINYQSWVTAFYASDVSCSSEVGDEEYTWYGYAKDNDYTTETSSGCHQRTTNGGTTLTSISGSLRTRNNTSATTITGRLRAWEDDSGSRCSYNTGALVNDDDCSTNVSATYSFSSPVEYQFAEVTRNIGNGSFSMDLRYKYRYSIENMNTAVDNTEESFSTTGSDRPFWGARGSWASDGVDCAASGTIGNNQSSVFRTTVSNKSSVTFKWRVSSEPNDYLQVFVNGVLDEQISGETSWETKTIDLTETNNTIEWKYQKNGSSSSGTDRGFVDAISFEDATLSTISNKLDYVSIFPNPVKSTLNLKGLRNEVYSLEIYDVSGRKVIGGRNISKTLDVSTLKKGFYIVKLYTKTSSKTFKIMKK